MDGRDRQVSETFIPPIQRSEGLCRLLNRCTLNVSAGRTPTYSRMRNQNGNNLGTHWSSGLKDVGTTGAMWLILVIEPARTLPGPQDLSCFPSLPTRL